MVRIEAGLIFANYEFTDQTDPFEAGIGFTVPLKSKTDDFIGKQALHPAQGASAPQAGRASTSSPMRPWAMAIASMSAAPRSASSPARTRSPILSKNIALARVDVLHSEIGTEVEIGKLDGMQKRLPGRIVRFAHYDPEKLRPRS